MENPLEAQLRAINLKFEELALKKEALELEISATERNAVLKILPRLKYHLIEGGYEADIDAADADRDVIRNFIGPDFYDTKRLDENILLIVDGEDLRIQYAPRKSSSESNIYLFLAVLKSLGIPKEAISIKFFEDKIQGAENRLAGARKDLNIVQGALENY